MKTDGHFYGRNSASCYQLDVMELRQAFSAGAATIERMRAFRVDRLMRMQAGETPLPIVPDGKMVFHMLPLSSFSTMAPPRIELASEHRAVFSPPGALPGTSDVNLDGYIYDSHRREERVAYTQVFRSGAVEVAFAFAGHKDYPKAIPTGWIGTHLFSALKRYRSALEIVEITAPFALALSFVGAAEHGIALGERFNSVTNRTLARDLIALPEIYVEQQDFEPAAALRPAFDMLWNAVGYERCLSYDEEGQWIGKA